MSKILTANNVEMIFMACLFSEGEDTSSAVEAKGILHDFGFHPERLDVHREAIKGLLNELPAEFQSDMGGGMSFLNACVTKHGDQWGGHQQIEQLLVLGLATKQAAYCTPRMMWGSLPGGMPYFSVVA